MYTRRSKHQSGDKVGGSELEVVTVALSMEHQYNDEETLGFAQPKNYHP